MAYNIACYMVYIMLVRFPESRAVGDQTQLIQIQTSDLLANLFDFKHGAMAFSPDPERLGSVLLFNKHKVDNTVLIDSSMTCTSTCSQLARHVVLSL